MTEWYPIVFSLQELKSDDLMVLYMLKTLVFENSDKKSLTSPEKYKTEKEKKSRETKETSD